MARPRLPIPTHQVLELGRRGWLPAEMARFYNCSQWLFYKRFKSELRQARAQRALVRELERCEKERLKAEEKAEERALLWIMRGII